MNPLDWLKALYEAFGVRNPPMSYVVVACIGAVISSGLWFLGAKQVEKDKANETKVSAPESPKNRAEGTGAATAGPGGAANSGVMDGVTINNNNQSPSDKSTPKAQPHKPGKQE